MILLSTNVVPPFMGPWSSASLISIAGILPGNN